MNSINNRFFVPDYDNIDHLVARVLAIADDYQSDEESNPRVHTPPSHSPVKLINSTSPCSTSSLINHWTQREELYEASLSFDIDDYMSSLPLDQNDDIQNTTSDQIPLSCQPATSVESSGEPSSSSDPEISGKRVRALITPSSKNLTRHNYTKVSYIVALLQLFKNDVPEEKPEDIPHTYWESLKELAQQHKLVEIVSRSPFIIKTDAKLDFFYYTLARFGYDQAMRRSDPKDRSYTERQLWWSYSSMFGAILSSKTHPNQQGKNWIYKTINLPQIILQQTQHLSDVDTLNKISNILSRTLQLTLDEDELFNVLEYGVEMRKISILRPIKEALKITMEESFQDSHSPQIEASVTPMPNEEIAPAKRQRTLNSQYNEAVPEGTALLRSSINSVRRGKIRKNRDTLAKYYAATLLIAKGLPSEKPAYMSNETWDYLKNQQEQSKLIHAVKRSENGKCLTFQMPCSFDDYCKAVAIIGETRACNNECSDNTLTTIRWWGINKKSENPIPFVSTLVKGKNGSINEILRSIVLPEELASNSKFNDLPPSSQLEVISDLFMKIISTCLLPDQLEKGEKVGFANVILRVELIVGYKIALEAIMEQFH